jgi:hypothetical protein
MLRQGKPLLLHTTVPYRSCILIPLRWVRYSVVGWLLVGQLVGFPPKGI